MFNIKGTLYYIYDVDNNPDYYLLHRYDRKNPVRIPKDIANKYLIRDYLAIRDFRLCSGTKIYKFDKLTLCMIDDDIPTYYFSLIKTKEDAYAPYDIIQKYLAPVWRENNASNY